MGFSHPPPPEVEPCDFLFSSPLCLGISLGKVEVDRTFDRAAKGLGDSQISTKPYEPYPYGLEEVVFTADLLTALKMTHHYMAFAFGRILQLFQATNS